MSDSKIEKYLSDENYMKKLYEEESLKKVNAEDDIILKLKIDGKPEAYARPRVVRGGHAYNPKAKIMDDIHKKLLSMVSITYDLSQENYTVELKLMYYIPIAKNESIKNTIKKELGFIRPTTRPDLDNYDKFIIDVLHGIAYDDDKKVVNVNSSKYYSINPRTEIIATIHYNS